LDTPVLMFSTVTFTPGNAAPVESLTTPRTSPELVLCPNTIPANPAHSRAARIIVDHFGFIISPPEVVVAGSILLRPFVSQYDLLATVTFLGVIRKFEFFLKTNGCLFLDKKVRIHLAPTEEQSSSSSGRRIRTFFAE
jgi:hypothetical protein